jgi:cellulose synthase operon protein C
MSPLPSRRGALAALVLLAAVAPVVAGCRPGGATLADLPLRGALEKRVRTALEKRARAGDTRAASRLGWLDLLEGARTEGPLGAFERALASNPKDPLALLGRGLILDARDAPARAARAWTSLLEACAPSAKDPLCEAASLFALDRLIDAEHGPLPALEGRLEALLGAGPPPLVRDRLLSLALRRDLRQGKVQRLEEDLAAFGCPAAWSVRGPAHGLPMLDLGVEIPGPAVRLPVSRSCHVSLYGLSSTGGIYLLETDLVAKAPASAIVTVETRSPFRLLLDGERVFERASLESAPLGWTRLSVPVLAGRHRLGLRVGQASAYGSLTARVVFPDGTPLHLEPPPAVDFRSPSRPASGAPTARDLGCGETPARILEGARLEAWLAPVAELLAARASLVCVDLDAARDHLERARRYAPRFFELGLLAIEIDEKDSSLPDRISMDRTVAAARALLTVDPALSRAKHLHAVTLLRQGRSDDALDSLREGAAAWPDDPRFFVDLQRAYRDLGYRTLEEEALDSAIRLAPERCDLLEDRAALLRARKDVRGAAALLEKVALCDASSGVRLALRVDEGRLDEALDEARRLLRLRGEDAAHARREIAHLLTVLGRGAEAEAELSRLLETRALSPDNTLGLADLLLLRGEKERARSLLERALDRRPTDAQLARALERLTGRTAMEAYRRDGMAAIKAFLAEGKSYDSSSVLVLDYMATRIFEDGAQVSVIHEIRQVLKKEGIERAGEVHIPSRARVLTLRTIKPDGTTREPEEIAGKSGRSLPDLETSDFVEVEFIHNEAAPHPGEPFAAGRFSFQSFGEPFHHSEYVVVAPRSLHLLVDPRGKPPALERKNIEARGDLEELRWIARDRPRLIEEPLSVFAEELLPSVRVTSGVTFERQSRILLQATAQLVGNAETRRIAAEIVARARTPEEKARALFRWVLENIKPEGSSSSTSAARVILSRKGDPVAALTSLLRQVGIPAEIVWAKPIHAPRISSEVPPVTQYGVAVVRCTLPGGVVTLSPREYGDPFGWVHTALRGADTLRPTAAGPVFERLASTKTDVDERRLDLRARLDEAGGAVVEARETAWGTPAILHRNILRHLDRTKLKQFFEQRILAEHFPGGSLEELTYEGEKEPERPLVIRYRFRTTTLARKVKGGLLVKLAPVSQRMAQIYLTVARRVFPLQRAFRPAVFVRLEVVPPAGFAATRLPPAVELSSAFGTMRRKTAQGPAGRIVVESEARESFLRVEPADFPSFARFVGDLEEKEQAELLLEKRAVQGGAIPAK